MWLWNEIQKMLREKRWRVSALTDEDPMPFGKHKGQRMADVPASYFAWLKDQGCAHPGVRGYIENSWSAILSELPDRIED
jgi:uncharacterized protein (DUF3820 family)